LGKYNIRRSLSEYCSSAVLLALSALKPYVLDKLSITKNCRLLDGCVLDKRARHWHYCRSVVYFNK